MKLQLLGLFQSPSLPFMTHLCFNNSLSPPVFDLAHLLLALRWVQNHIHNTLGAILWSEISKRGASTLLHCYTYCMCEPDVWRFSFQLLES